MKKLVIGIVIGLFLGMSTNAFAAIGDSVQAVFASFSYAVNGESKTIDSPVLVYEGTSYVRTTDISNMLGYDVTYKANSRTIEFTNPESTPSPKPASSEGTVVQTPSPSPSPTPSTTPSTGVDSTPAPTVSPEPAPSASPAPSATPSPSPAPTPSATPEPTPKPIPSAADTPQSTQAPAPSGSNEQVTFCLANRFDPVYAQAHGCP